MDEDRVTELSREAKELQKKGRYREASGRYDQVAEHWRRSAVSADGDDRERYQYLAEYWGDVAESARALAEFDESMRTPTTVKVTVSSSIIDLVDSISAKASDVLKHALDTTSPNQVVDQRSQRLGGDIRTSRQAGQPILPRSDSQKTIRQAQRNSYLSNRPQQQPDIQKPIYRPKKK